MFNDYKLIVVIHETVVSCEDILLYHQSPTYRASYHVCIDRLGTIVYLVPSQLKAYGAANSRYIDKSGNIEQINGSVDDFAYHIALETPEDGRNIELVSHSGYTEAQYKSLIWLINKTGVAPQRIVRHDEVYIGRNGCIEPRSFDKSKFSLLNIGNREIDLGVIE